MFKVSKSWNVLSHDLIIDVAADEMPTVIINGENLKNTFIVL
jgi:hypothetical protein